MCQFEWRWARVNGPTLGASPAPRIHVSRGVTRQNATAVSGAMNGVIYNVSVMSCAAHQRVIDGVPDVSSALCQCRVGPCRRHPRYTASLDDSVFNSGQTGWIRYGRRSGPRPPPPAGDSRALANRSSRVSWPGQLVIYQKIS